ncbi:MAG: DUF6494 family protein [Anaerolineales bacterium]
MDDDTRMDIRKLLKEFGIKADEAITAHLAHLSSPGPLRVRLVLEDETDYHGKGPQPPLHLEIRGEVKT